MHDNVMKMGNIIRNAREAKGLTQVALAELIDVTERTVIAIDNNNVRN